MFSSSIGIRFLRDHNEDGSWFQLRVPDGAGIVAMFKLWLQDCVVGLSKQQEGVF